MTLLQRVLRPGCCKTSLLCDASGTRIDALMSRLFEPEKAVAFTSFSAIFLFSPLKTATNFHRNTKTENFCGKRYLL